MPDVSRLVRIDRGVFDDRLVGRAERSRDFVSEPRDQKRGPFEIEIQISIRRGDNAFDSLHPVDVRGQILSDRPGRLAKGARELKCHGDRQIAKGSIGRHFDRKWRDVGQPVALADGTRDVIVDDTLNGKNHVQFRSAMCGRCGKLVLRLRLVTLERLEGAVL